MASSALLDRTTTTTSTSLLRELWRVVLAFVASLFALFWPKGVAIAQQQKVKPPPPPPPPPIKPDDGLGLECLAAHTAESFGRTVRSRLGRGDALARVLYRAYFSSGSFSLADPPHEICAASSLGGRLLGLIDVELPLRFAPSTAAAAAAADPAPESASAAGSRAAPPKPGETEKYVLQGAGGEEVEMVAMPAPGAEGAWSLCISSQVGCKMGCAFCETGKMGLLRNLDVGEIVSQVALAVTTLRLRVANVIFMGMGEPLDNVHAVIEAIEVMTDPAGLNIPLSHVTVSTSGEAQHIYTLQAALPAVRLAFSLHAANDTLRSRLMPINRRVPLAELGPAMASYVARSKKRVLIQYVLLADVNDAPEHAAELAAFLATVGPPSRLCVNLIPYNPQSRPTFCAPTHEACKAFKTALQHAGLFVKIREEKGQQKMAACGQLGNVRLRRDLNRRRKQALAEQQEESASGGADRMDAQALTSDEAALEEAAAGRPDAFGDLDLAAAQGKSNGPRGGAAAGCLCDREELAW